MRVVGEIEAGFRVGGAAAGIDPEGTNLPVRRYGPHEEEDRDQPGEK